MAPDGICGDTHCFPDFIRQGGLKLGPRFDLDSLTDVPCAGGCPQRHGRRGLGNRKEHARSVVTVVCWGTGNSFFVITQYKSRNAPTLCLKLEAATERMYFFPILARISWSEPNRYAFSTRSGWSCAHVTTVRVLTMCGPSSCGLSFLTQTSHGTERSQTKMNKCCAVKVFKAKHGWEDCRCSKCEWMLWNCLLFYVPVLDQWQSCHNMRLCLEKASR